MISYYYVTKIKLGQKPHGVKLPADFIDKHDDRTQEIAIRSYLFSFEQVTFEKMLIEDNRLVVVHDEQPWDEELAHEIGHADDYVMRDYMFSHTGAMVVPVDTKVLKYVDASRHDEVIDYEITAYLHRHLPVTILFLG